jgi:hypothetical protein
MAISSRQPHAGNLSVLLTNPLVFKDPSVGNRVDRRERLGGDPRARGCGHLVSNEVVIKASIAQGPPIVHVCTRHCLPNTGSAAYLMELGALGGLAILAGAAMLARGRRRGEVTE